MRTTWLVSMLLLPGLCAAAMAQAPATHGRTDDGPSPDDPVWRPHRALKVLYAGSAGGHREQVFGEFLGRWFDTTDTLPLAELSMATARDFDVVVVDWVSQYGNDGYPARGSGLSSAPGQLGPDFTKPFVSMTYVGSQVRPQHKLDWL